MSIETFEIMPFKNTIGSRKETDDQELISKITLEMDELKKEIGKKQQQNVFLINDMHNSKRENK